MKLLDKEKLEKLINEGLTTQQIADELKLSRATITRNKTYYGFRSQFYSKKHNIKKCLNCSKDFNSLISEDRKFCSQSCSAVYINLCKGDNKLNEYGIIEKDGELFKLCKNCEQSFLVERKRMSESKKFCSSKCHRNYEEKLRFQEVENNGNVSQKTIKLYLIKKYGNKCMCCAWDKVNPTSKKVPIELEHIDGNSENNKLENLKLLCPNCHSLTPTYKALNKGKGRHQRMKRYNEGKSY
jgi:hypothetical protein